MIQYEFAQRLVAKPDSELYCRLTVNTSLLANVWHLIKVGKGNFRPPPQVDSSVVRIEPRNPPYDVDYIEWDGLTRICFMRKNKTLGALFRNDHVVEMLHTNYCALQKLKASDSSPSSLTLPTIEETKETIVKLLQDSGFEQKRASKLDLDQFMQLLILFNEAGFHFSS